MTIDQAKAVEPLLAIDHPDEFGVIRTTINPHFDPRFNQKTFADVRTISLDFLDGKLVTLWIGYDETLTWPPLDKFVVDLGNSLNLPPHWPVKRSGRELTCDGFSIFVSMIAGAPSLRVRDEQAELSISARREEAAAAAEAQVIGDSKTRMYYPSDCPAREDVPSTARVVFKNQEEAEQAGYKPAKSCQ